MGQIKVSPETLQTRAREYRALCQIVLMKNFRKGLSN